MKDEFILNCTYFLIYLLTIAFIYAVKVEQFPITDKHEIANTRDSMG